MEVASLSKSNSEPFQLSLRIRHPSMDPADISRAFKIQAEHSFRAGEPRNSNRSGSRASVYPESYWLGVLKPLDRLLDITFPGSPRSQMAQRQLDAATHSLSWALSLRAIRTLNPHADLLRRIRSEGGEVTLLVTIYDQEVSSFTVAPEASRLFGELGIAVEFDLASD